MMELSPRERQIFIDTVISTVVELIERAEREGKADVADWLLSTAEELIERAEREGKADFADWLREFLKNWTK